MTIFFSNKKIRKILNWCFVLGAAIVFLTNYMALSMPWKITDPQNPSFDENNFRFSDYEESEDLQEVLRTMFPIGTPRKKVDRILFENQPKYDDLGWGAYFEEKNDLQKPKENNVVWYVFVPALFPINIYNLQFYYDEKDTVREIADHGVPLYNKNFYKE